MTGPDQINSRRLRAIPGARGPRLAGLALLLSVVTFANPRANGQIRPGPAPDADQGETTPADVADPNTVMEMYVGAWSVTERHFDAKGEIAATVKGTEEVTWLLDKHAIQRAYNRPTSEGVFRAIGIVTFSEATDRFEGSWYDNRSVGGQIRVDGTWNPETRTMVLTMTQHSPGGGSVTHRVVEKFVDESHRISTTYHVAADQVVTRLLEVQYVRSVPCPSKIRRIFDG